MSRLVTVSIFTWAMDLSRLIDKVRRRSSLLLCVTLASVFVAMSPVRGSTDEAPSLEVVLARTGLAVGHFWRQLSSVTCTESVTQEKISNRGKVEYRQASQFDYLMLIKVNGEEVAVEESRLVKKTVGKGKDLPLLTTSGFQTLVLVFHPVYRDSFHYQMDGAQVSGNKKLVLVRFEHIPGTRSTSALSLQSRIYPLDLRGTAWIDPETGIIQRMVAELAAPLDALNFRALYTKVEYLPQHFSSAPDSFWLPSRATVEVKTAQQHWRNVHQYSDYRRFSVSSEGTIVK